MTSNPTKVDVDIKSLLNLLNASEESGAASDVSAEIIDEPEPPEAQHLTSLEKLASVASQLSADDAGGRMPDGIEDKLGLDSSDNESLQDDNENRFAAHIVQGMSKLIQGMSKLKRE
jgi:hypothetical protein